MKLVLVARLAVQNGQTTSVMTPLFLALASLLVACATPEIPPWQPIVAPGERSVQDVPESGGAVKLAQLLAEARLGGRAAELADRPLPIVRRTIVDADFDHGPGLFRPYFGDHPGDGNSIRVADDDGVTGQVLHLRGPATHGVSARTEPLPVRPGERYILSYRFRAEGLPPNDTGRAGPRARASLIGFRGRRRMGMIPSFHPPRARSGEDWRLIEIPFRVPDWSDHLAVSLDLGRPLDDRSPYRATGEVWFDDVTLIHETSSPFVSFADTADAPRNRAMRGMTLRGRVALRGPAGPRWRETRTAIYAPAPSVFAWSLTIPDKAMLELGTGLLPQTGGGTGRVRFAVELRDETGRVHLVHAHTVTARSDEWHDRTVDLSRWSGQRVELRLVTAADATAAAAPTAAPAASAFWADPTVRSSDGAGRSVVLVGIDTLGAGRTSPWGHAPATTPSLERIAAAGTRYEHALSPSPWTLPAFASLLTGLRPGEHAAGGVDPAARAGRRGLGERHPTLASRLQQAGWTTRAWINNPFLTRGFGLARGFDRHVDYGTRAAPGAARTALDSIEAWLRAGGADDRFAFVHLMEPHGPYKPTAARREQFARQPGHGSLADGMSHDELRQLANGALGRRRADRDAVAALYDAVVADADDALGRVYDAAMSREGAGEVLFIVVADHGEELWEHDRFEHGHSVYDELLRVPLVIVAPGRAKGAVVRDPVSSLVVADEILDFAADPPPRAPTTGPAATLSTPAVVGGRTLYGPDLWYAVVGHHKLVVQADDRLAGTRAEPARPVRLFDLSADPREQRDLLNRLRGVLEDEPAAALREAWSALGPELLRSLVGHWVIAIRPGLAGGEKLDGTLAVARGALPGPRRFLAWPGPGGVPAAVTLRRSRDGTAIGFSLPAPGALVAVPAWGPAEHELLVTLRSPPDGGPEQRRLTKQDVVDPLAFFGADAGRDIAMQLGFVADSGVARSFDPALLDQLRALGYLR